MADRELKIIIKADGSVAVEEIAKLAKGVEGLGGNSEKANSKLTKLTGAVLGTGKSVEKMSKDVEKAKTSWSELTTGINQAWEILGKGKRIFEMGWGMAEQGAKLQEARNAFEDYTRSVGENSNEILAKLRAASSGTISDMGLITTASKAMSLGVVKNGTQMANLLEIARNKARLFGMDTTEAFNDIVTGIGRGSPLILDNLGIRIPEAFEEMTKGMSGADKTATLLNMVLEEGNNQLSKMGPLTNSAADDLRAFETSVENLKGSFGELMTTALSPFVTDLKTDVIPAVREAIQVFQDWSGNNEKIERMLRSQGQAGILASKQLAIDSAKKRQAELDRVLSQTYDGLSSYDQQRIGQNYAGNRNATIDEIRQAIVAKSQSIDLEIQAIMKEVEKAKSKIKNLKEIDNFWSATEAELAAEEAERLKTTGEAAQGASGKIKELKVDFQDLGTAAAKSLDMIGDGFDDFGDDVNKLLDDFDAFGDDMDKLLKRITDIDGAIAGTLSGAGKNWSAELARLDPETAATGMMNFMTGGLFTASGNNAAEAAVKDISEPLSKSVAEAVAIGFANADLSNFAQSIGGILSQVLSQSIAKSNPILNATGGVNWGNLGINIGANLAISALTQPGRFFGGRQDKFKEQTLQAASDLRSRMSETWKQSQETSLLPFLTSSQKNDLAAGRYGYYGTQTGHSWSDSGNGIWSDKTRTYNLIDQGASAALAKLTQAIENAERYNRSVEMGYELQSARGYDYQALVSQEAAYRRAANAASGGTRTLSWTDGGKDTVDLAEAAHEIKMAAAEMARSLGQANAGRSASIAQGFTKYAPWLDTLQMTDMSILSSRQQYGLFDKMQTSLMDRNIPMSMLGMVKQAGQNQYGLQELNFTDPEAYQAKYLEYVEKQLDAFEEVMKRQEQIFYDSAKSYEERVSALEVYEQSMEAYHQAKLEKLRAEKILEEQEKQLMAESRQAKMESALSLIGEVSQRGDKVMIIQAGDATVAIKELMAEFQDNPDVVAVLQSTLTKTEAKARWGN